MSTAMITMTTPPYLRWVYVIRKPSITRWSLQVIVAPVTRDVWRTRRQAGYVLSEPTQWLDFVRIRGTTVYGRLCDVEEWLMR